MHRGFFPLHKRIASAFSRSHDSPSNDRFSPRARFTLHGKQYFRNTATLGILLFPLHSMIHRLQTEKRDSFRVRDSHPIPLFSEQECVSERFFGGLRFRVLPALPFGSRICHKSHTIQLSARSVFGLHPALILYFSTQKDLFCPAISQTKEVSYSLYIQFRCTQKIRNYTARWLVGWLVGCKNCAKHLHFYNHLPCLRTSPFQNLHPYLTAIRGNCKEGKFLEGLGGFWGARVVQRAAP